MRSDAGVRHNITLLAVLVGILVAGYTLVVLLFAPGDLLGWVSTLVSTVASVWAALLIGLILFQHQTQETDRKMKEELAELLKTELGEVRRVIGRLRTDVQEEALETTENSFTSHGMQCVLHYSHPLIVEEAARSGLFDTEQTSEMLVLAHTMRQHNVLRQEAMTLRVEAESQGCLRRSVLRRGPDGHEVLQLGLACPPGIGGGHHKQVYKAARKYDIAAQKCAACIAPAQTSPTPEQWDRDGGGCSTHSWRRIS